MTAEQSELTPLPDPDGKLERAFMQEFLRARGHDLRSVETLPEDERKQLLRDASMYAAARLAEVQARAHFLGELRGER
jgi:hypothetical protein